MSKPIKDLELAVRIFNEFTRLGVMPTLDSGLRLKEHLDRLSPEESKKLRRRFRKLWRKLAKKTIDSVAFSPKHEWYGLGEAHPTSFQMFNRKYLVFTNVLMDVERQRSDDERLRRAEEAAKRAR